MGYVQKKGLDLLWAKSKRRTDNKISYQCGTDNRFYGFGEFGENSVSYGSRCGTAVRTATTCSNKTVSYTHLTLPTILRV